MLLLWNTVWLSSSWRFHEILGITWNAFGVKCFSHYHDDVIKWKHFPRYWPFVRGIHRGPVNSPHKGQWRGALMFSFICVWINGWVNNRKAGDLRRYRAHYDVIVMINVMHLHQIATLLLTSIFLLHFPEFRGIEYNCVYFDYPVVIEIYENHSFEGGVWCTWEETGDIPFKRRVADIKWYLRNCCPCTHSRQTVSNRHILNNTFWHIDMREPIFRFPNLMMTSSNGNIFHVTGHLCGEFTGPRWIPAQRPVTRDFDVFFVLRPNKLLSKQSWGWCFETPSRYYDIIVMLFVCGEWWWAGAGVGWGAAGLQDISVFSAIQIWRWKISNRLLRWLDMFIDRIKTFFQGTEQLLGLKLDTHIQYSLLAIRSWLHSFVDQENALYSNSNSNSD